MTHSGPATPRLAPGRERITAKITASGKPAASVLAEIVLDAALSVPQKMTKVTFQRLKALQQYDKARSNSRLLMSFLGECNG